MKIERVNDNQIRCTLSKEDLEDRQIKLSELAYGSEKAKGLFHDMIQQANYEFGFEAEDAPLMVEAIPLSGDHIILQITKVEYPDELDTRFSRFTESEEDEEEMGDGNHFPKFEGADDILDVFKKLHKNTENVKEDMIRVFEFANLDGMIRLAHILGDYYSGANKVYKDMQTNRYYLFLHKSQHTPEEFNKVCNMVTEYGVQRKYTPAQEGYFKEHGKMILKEQALQILNSL